ncbi:MAG: phospholipase D family protein [Xanthomonadales bacterium]|nr:phospholipase D family protein [Xanthomonadales bacterium]
MKTIGRAVLCLSLVALLGACASAPIDYPRTPSAALTDTGGTALAKASADWRKQSPISNGFYPLTRGKDAFGARLKLIEAAAASIDVQYFLMKPDDAGLVFSAKLIEAADRGVRVRFLLDDIFTTVDDVGLSLLDEHPNIELRIFNPVSRKGIEALNYAGNFKLANRRMHNKSFTVDNQVSIVGGRNIAAEYFQLETSGEFIDFDMLASGPIVQEISASFDTYWNHKLAVPFEAMLTDKVRGEQEQRHQEAVQKIRQSGYSIYADVTNTEVMQQLLAGELDPYLAGARMIVDDPDKLLNKISIEQQRVTREIWRLLNAAQSEIIIYTPYFIPRERGLDLIRALTARGVRIVLITNSLATNNHTPVHSAYASHRRDVLEAGVELWEARADAAKITAPDGSTQLEQLTLHTKGILIDRQMIFVGSLNLDPRSIDINTEMGVLIESPDLAGKLTDSTLAGVGSMAYRVKMDENRKLSWHATIDGREVVETREPQTSAWRRFQAWFMKIAPEDQL